MSAPWHGDPAQPCTPVPGATKSFGWKRPAGGQLPGFGQYGTFWPIWDNRPLYQYTSLLFHPLDPDLIYIGTFPAGVFKSTDGGLNWKEHNVGWSNDGVFSLVFRPGNPDVIYAGTYNGINRSLDAGAHWETCSDGWPAEQWVFSIDFDPYRPEILYACAKNGENMGRGREGFHGTVMKSTDAGRTWITITDGLDIENEFYKIIVDRHDPRRLFLASQNDGVFVSTDAGSSWAPYNEGLTEPHPGTNGNNVTNTMGLSPDGNWLYFGSNGSGVFRRFIREDADGDMLADPWEMAHFSGLEIDGTGDKDNDGLSDRDEYRHLTDPTAPDSDGDGYARRLGGRLRPQPGGGRRGSGCRPRRGHQPGRIPGRHQPHGPVPVSPARGIWTVRAAWRRPMRFWPFASPPVSPWPRPGARAADVNGDGTIGVAEAIYILEVAAGLRHRLSGVRPFRRGRNAGWRPETPCIRRRLDGDPPTPMHHPFPPGIVFRQGGGGDFLDTGQVQPRHTGTKVLVVRGKKRSCPRASSAPQRP